VRRGVQVAALAAAHAVEVRDAGEQQVRPLAVRRREPRVVVAQLVVPLALQVQVVRGVADVPQQRALIPMTLQLRRRRRVGRWCRSSR
jgi:hypothetical protein